MSLWCCWLAVGAHTYFSLYSRRCGHTFSLSLSLSRRGVRRVVRWRCALIPFALIPFFSIGGACSVVSFYVSLCVGFVVLAFLSLIGSLTGSLIY